jgi:hypothetical protein
MVNANNRNYNTQKMVQPKKLQNSYVQTNNSLTGTPLKGSKFRLNKDLFIHFNNQEEFKVA